MPLPWQEEGVQCVCWGEGEYKERRNVVLSPQEMICNSFPSIIWVFSEGFPPYAHDPPPPAREDPFDSTVKLKVRGLTPLRAGHS